MLIPLLMFSVAGIGVVAIVLVLVLGRSTETTAGTTGNAPVGSISLSQNKKEEDVSKEQLRERLIHAGLYRQNSIGYYYLVQLIMASIPVAMCLVAYRVGLLSFWIAVLSGMACGILAIVGPGLWLDYQKSKRQTSVRKSMPDALDVITICVEAGLSLNSALVRVSKDTSVYVPTLGNGVSDRSTPNPDG